MINPFTHRKILKNGKPGRGKIISMSMPDAGASSQNIAMTLQVFVEGMVPYEVEDQWMVSRKDSLGFGMELPVKVDADKPQKVAIDWDAHRAEQSQEEQARRAALAAQGPVGASPPVGVPAGVGGIGDPLAAAGMAGAAGALGGMAGGGAMPAVDMRNDPELRAKVEAVLGRTLTPGTTETLDFTQDPALGQRVMAVIQQHAMEKAGLAPASAPADAGAEDAVSQLERLAKLKESGALTEEEFAEQKRKILGG